MNVSGWHSFLKWLTTREMEIQNVPCYMIDFSKTMKTNVIYSKWMQPQNITHGERIWQEVLKCAIIGKILESYQNIL